MLFGVPPPWSTHEVDSELEGNTFFHGRLYLMALADRQRFFEEELLLRIEKARFTRRLSIRVTQIEAALQALPGGDNLALQAIGDLRMLVLQGDEGIQAFLDNTEGLTGGVQAALAHHLSLAKRALL